MLSSNGDFTFSVLDRKTATGASSAWTISDKIRNWSSPVPYWRAMMAARNEYKKKPLPDHVFMQMRGGKMMAQRFGKRALSDLPKEIARFNGLDHEKYTGYAFRRSSATALANEGGSVHQLRQHLGHRSLGVATEYIDSSKAAQKTNSERLAGISLTSIVSQSTAQMTSRTPASSNVLGSLFGPGAFSRIARTSRSMFKYRMLDNYLLLPMFVVLLITAFVIPLIAADLHLCFFDYSGVR